MLEFPVAVAEASWRGDDMALASEARRTLMYGHLVVADAAEEGIQRAARMRIPSPDRPQNVVADAGATYPSRSIR